MSPHTLKDLSRAISSYIPTPSLPLPSDLVDIIQSFLDKNEPFDEAESQKLHEELITIYQDEVQGRAECYAPFIAVLRRLRPAIRGYKRLLQWWDLLVVPILDHLGEQKDLATEARDVLLEILVYDEDENNEEDIKASNTFAFRLFEGWLKKSRIAEDEGDAVARSLQLQIQKILIGYGRARLKDFLVTLDRFFVQKEYRAEALAFLSEFIRNGPPHLYILLQTPLWGSLIDCLELDTSTTIISLALTNLNMLLPHMPNSVMKYVPTLFNIYTRILFWEREITRKEHLDPDEKDETSSEDEVSSGKWAVLYYSPEVDGNQVPQLLHYFTFLYGLYPINFMSYIRKPSKYLRHANAEETDDFDVQSSEVRERSEHFRRLHLLHPNFFTMTQESELNRSDKWMKSEAADVTAACMELYCAPIEGHFPLRAPSTVDTENTSHRRSSATEAERESSLGPLDEDTAQGTQSAWRNTATTLVAVEQDTLARLDSPTVPPQLMEMTVPHLSTLAGDRAASRPFDNSHWNEKGHNAEKQDTGKANYLQKEIMLLKNELTFERYLKQQHLSHISKLRIRYQKQAEVEADTQNIITANRALKSKLSEARENIAQIRKDNEKSRSHAKKWEADQTSKLRAIREEQRRWTTERERLTKELATSQDDRIKMVNIIVESEARELRTQQRMQSIETDAKEIERLRTEIKTLTTKIRRYEALEIQYEMAKNERDLATSNLVSLEMTLEAQLAESNAATQAHLKEINGLRVQLSKHESEERKKQSATFQKMLDSSLAVSRKRLLDTQKAHGQLLKNCTSLEGRLLTALKALEMEKNKVAGNRPALDENLDQPLLDSAESPPEDDNALQQQFGSPGSEIFTVSDLTQTQRPKHHALSDVEGGTIPTIGVGFSPGALARSDSLNSKPGLGLGLRSRSDLVPTSLSRSSTSASQQEARHSLIARNFERVGFPLGQAHSRSGSWEGSTSASMDSDRATVGSSSGHGSTAGPLSRDTGGEATEDTVPTPSHGPGGVKIQPQSEIRVYGRGGVQNIGKKEKDKKDKKKDSDDKKGKGSNLRGIRGFVS